MSAALKHEIEELKKRRKKAQNEGDLIEEAKICNQLGDLSSQCGDHQLALNYHQCELSLSEAVGDRLGAAVAHRRIGECECELGNYAAALSHQQEHLRVAEELGDLAEVQRALTTLGRTYLHQSDLEKGEATDQLLLKAGTAFLKSLDVCDKLVGIVQEKEVLSMRSRSYLNLGIVYEIRGDYKRAQEFMQKALGIVKELGDSDTVFRCHLDLGSLHLKEYHPTEAMNCFRESLAILKKKPNSQQMTDALKEMAKAHLLLSDFEAAKDCLKKVCKLARDVQGGGETTRYSLHAVNKVIKYRREVELLGMDHVIERLQLLEKLGDLCCNLGAFPSALQYYEQQLSLAEAHGMEPEALAKVYYSLASTHADCRQFSEAMTYYEKELKLWECRPLELCSTWSNIARLHEAAGRDKSEVQKAYHRAIECAKEANSPQDLIAVYRSLLSYCQASPGMKAERMVCEQELASLLRLHPHADVPAQDTDTPSLSEDSLTSHTSDCGSEIEEDKASFPIEAPSRTQQSRRKSRVFKKNEKGETLLHIAAADDNMLLVEQLIKEGADVSAQDHCGWTPLHEASNRGHLGVARMLLNHGANVNDKGGTHCNGTTPLMDAALNGHREMVDLLLEYGANPLQMNTQGQTVLDTLESSLSQVQSESGQAYELREDHQAILELLQNHLTKDGRYSTSARNDHVTGTQSSGRVASSNLPSVVNRKTKGRGARYNPLGQLESPALIPEEEEGEEMVCTSEEWLVDDMAPPTRKRHHRSDDGRREMRDRRRVQYRSRSLVPATGDVQVVTAASSPNPHSSSSPTLLRNAPAKNTPPKCTPPKGTPTKDVDPRGKNASPVVGTMPGSAPPTDTALRLRVSIEEKVYLIPCPRKVDGHDATVAWLTSQAAERYCAHQGIRPTLTLTTVDGAHLSPADALIDVLQNNEEVRGVVEHKELPPLAERYQTACRNMGGVCHSKSLQLFQLSNHIAALDLSHIGLGASHAAALFHALRGLGTLTSLNLCGNALGNALLPHLDSCVAHLPSLIHLDISCTGVTDQGFVRLVGSARVSAPIEEDSVWRPLQRLNLAYNGIGGDGARGVAALLRRCSSLQSLVLEGCGFTTEDCECRELPDALKVLKCLSELRVSRNLLEIRGLDILLASLDVGCLRVLDLSATCSVSCICDGLPRAASLTLLQRLDVSYGCIGDEGVRDLVAVLETCTHLQDLGLAGNDLTQVSAGPLCGYLLSTAYLKTLDLSANSKLCNAACLQLLDAVLSTNVAVHLSLSSCGLESPLPLAAMVRPKQPVRMERLDLSGNNLNLTDCLSVCEWLGGFSLIHHNSIIVFVK